MSEEIVGATPKLDLGYEEMLTREGLWNDSFVPGNDVQFVLLQFLAIIINDFSFAISFAEDQGSQVLIQ